MTTDLNTSEKEKVRRDWVSILAPTILAVIISLAIQAGSAAWFFGAMNNRLSTLEQQQKIEDAQRVTQDDLKTRDAQRVIEKQELDIRLNRMDDKLDRLVELEMSRRHE